MADWYAIANADSIPSPAVLVYPERIRENLRRMIALAGGAEKLRPHVKTHKLPQIVRLKLAVGITKFKTSTIAESEMTAEAGGQDVLLSYPLVGPNIQRFTELIRRFPGTKFSSLIDTPEMLQPLSRMAQQAGVTLSLYVDLDVGLHRTGISPEAEALHLYRELSRTPALAPAGLHAYDGHLKNTDISALKQASDAAFAPVWQMRETLLAEGIPVPLVIASGTPTFSLTAAQPGVEVGCGTTVLWDFGQAITSPYLDFLNAAVLLTRVVSKPGQNRLCLDLGHKAVASEMTPPRVKLLGLAEAVPVIHSEEHLVVETPRANEFQVGDVLYGLPRHICPTMALHQEVWVVNNGHATETWPVVARARKLTI